ncbi:MAG TPA: hypothetical protein DCQ36_03705 [Actinobacteria bacterium]|jgi:uncharacterized membrane protein|nr:hypothetical protein [Actinomycetota bacterium]
MDEGRYTEVMLVVAQTFEVIAAGILIVGLVAAFVLAARMYLRTRDGRGTYQMLRQFFGGVLLLGLEVLVAGDLIRTVAVAPTLDNVLVLGIIVLIRTFLSFSLEIEIEGVPPWRRALVSGASVMSQAARKAGQS